VLPAIAQLRAEFAGAEAASEPLGPRRPEPNLADDDQKM
jgi:hypothetical protein